MKLTIGIPVYNGREVLRICLTSIFENIKSTDFEVIVCDDGSIDGTAEIVEREFPQVKLLKNPQNFGVSKSMNKIRQRRMDGRYFLRLDTDTKVLPGSVEGLIKFLERHPKAGIVASALVDVNGNIQKNYQEKLQTPIWWFREYLLWITKGLSQLRRRETTIKPKQVPVLGSAAILIRQEVLEKIGFDENIPFFMEDADFCMRAANAGWEIWYEPNVTIEHLGGHSDEKFYIHCRNRSLQSLYFFTQKHFPGRWSQVVLTFSILFGSAISLVLATTAWLPSRLHPRGKVIVDRAVRSFGNVFGWHWVRFKRQNPNDKRLLIVNC